VAETILSLDLGTSGLKAVLFDAEGNNLARSTCPCATRYGEGGRAEQDPEEWWKALVTVLGMLREQGGDTGSVSAIGISGHMMGAVPVDAGGKALGSALIHADTRAGEIADRLVERVGAERVYSVTGHRPSSSYSGPKIEWIRQNEPERYRAAAYFLNPKDYLNARLTGIIATDRSDASGTLLYDLSTHDWSPEMIESFGIDVEKLPPVLPSTTVLGTVHGRAAAETGLPASAAVVCGAGDGICAGVGAGSVAPGLTYNYLGTTSWVATTTAAPLADPLRRVFTFDHAVEGLYHSMGTMQSAGGAVEWFRSNYLGHISDAGRSYAMLDDLIAESVPGSRGVIFLPYLQGERSPWWNSGCTGGWYGLRMEHTMADMTRALFEGVANNLALIAEILDSFAPFRELSLLGGGGLSKEWPQILCDGFNKPLHLLEGSDAVTARGAAIIAGVGSGLMKDFSAARALSRRSRTLYPESTGAAVLKSSRKNLEQTYHRLFSGK
jgi:xylulokinase